MTPLCAGRLCLSIQHKTHRHFTVLPLAIRVAQALTLLHCLSTTRAIVVPRAGGSSITHTDGYLAPMDPYYYLTSYRSVTFRNSARFRTFYNSSVAQFPFDTLNHTWICYLHDPDVRLEHVVAGPRLGDLAQLVYVAGIAYRNGGSAQALYVASVLVTSKLAKVRHMYTSEPAQKVQISALSAAGKSLVVCGAMVRITQQGVNRQSQSNRNTRLGPEQKSAAFAFEFDDNLNLNRSLIPHRNGTVLDRCSGVSHGAHGAVHLLHTTYNTDHHSTGVAIPNTQISSFSSNSTQSGHRMLQWQSELDNHVSSLSDLNTSRIEPQRVILDRGSLYVVAKVRIEKEPPGHGLVIVKLAEATGVFFFVRVFGLPSEGTLVHGPVVASDNFVYILVRRAEYGTYSSEEIRLSIWGVHDTTHDRSGALWESDNTQGPTVALGFSLLDGHVKALGVVPNSNITTDGAEKISHLYQALPLSPATNDAKDAATPVGSEGSQFLRITFALAVEKGGKQALQVAVDMLANSLRVLPQNLVPESQAKKKSANERSVGARDRFALTVQGEDLNALEKQLRNDINEVAVKRVGKTETQLEKRTRIGRISLSDLKVESRGVSRIPGDNGGRSAADVAEDLVSNTTIAAVAIAAVLVLLVIIAVVVTKVRHAMKLPGSESEPTNPDLLARTDGRTFVTLGLDGTLSFTSSFGGSFGGGVGRGFRTMEADDLVLPE